MYKMKNGVVIIFLVLVAIVSIALTVILDIDIVDALAMVTGG